MIRATIDQDEWWPVYSLRVAESADYGPDYTVVELSDVEYADYRRVEGEFDAWQRRLSDIDKVRRDAERAETRAAQDAQLKAEIRAKQDAKAARRAEARWRKLSPRTDAD